MSDIVNKENLSDEQLVELTLENQEDFLYLINRYEEITENKAKSS